MGTLTNGIKEIFSTEKSTGTNVMLCGNDGTPDGHMTMDNLKSTLDVIKSLSYSRGNNTGPCLVKIATIDQNAVLICDLLCFHQGTSATEYPVYGYCKMLLGRLNGAARYKIIDTMLINGLKLYYKQVDGATEFYAYYTGTNRYTYFSLFPYTNQRVVDMTASSESIGNLTEIHLATT